MIPGSFSSAFNFSFLKYIIMTKQEIQALIMTQIAGQGNQVDIGGVLANVLLAIVDYAGPTETGDITALTGEQLDLFQPGNIVVKKTGDESRVYIVNYKDTDTGELMLTYADAEVVESVYYAKTDNVWGYARTETTTISE